MRDLIVVLIVLVAVPLTLRSPSVGVLLWSWLGYMNPHRLTWGFAYDMPFAQVAALATLGGLVFTKEPRRLPWTPITMVLVTFILWMGVTTLIAIDPGAALTQYVKVLKIQFMTIITMMVMMSRERLHALVWVIVVSIGFYGVKGGIFTIITGGEHHVLGPNRSFMSGNTEIGLAMVIVVPLMRYLHLSTENKWVRRGMLFAIVMTVVAILGTYSRGALLGLVGMGAVLWWKGRHRLALALVMAVTIPLMLAMLPEKWGGRMETIQTYEQDTSAMQRVLAWQAGFKIAAATFVGGGFGVFGPEGYQRYAPDIIDEGMALGIPEHLVYQDAHSIYFDVLGEHGFVGLFLFLLLGVFTWRTASRVMAATRRRQDLKWAYDLMSMTQASLAGYAVAGAFLSLAYFDLFYHVVAIVVVAGELVRRALEKGEENAKWTFTWKSVLLPSAKQAVQGNRPVQKGTM